MNLRFEPRNLSTEQTRPYYLQWKEEKSKIPNDQLSKDLMEAERQSQNPS